MSNLKGCFMHNTDDWRTPSSLYNAFIDNGFLDMFPYKCDYDQTEYSYVNSKLFVNPPYSKIKSLVPWLLKQIKVNDCVVLLVPARTDTQWFHALTDNFFDSPLIVFIKGRLSFNDSDLKAPFPSILLIYGRNYPFEYLCVDYDYIVNTLVPSLCQKI